MRRSSIPVVAVCGLLLALFLLAAGYLPLRADDGMAAGPAGNPFQGKVIVVYLRSKSMDQGYVLEDATITEQAGRQMLIGKHLAQHDGTNWIGGLRVVIPLDDASCMIEFADMADYTRRAKQALTAAPQRAATEI